VTWYADNPNDGASEEYNSREGWEEDYYADSKTFALHASRQSAFDAIAARLSTICPARGRLLDVGAGIGMLMQAAHKQGWVVEGIEPSRKAAEWARKHSGGVVHEGFLGEVKLPEGQYDALTMVDVLMQIPEPLPFLQAARRLVRPGGILMIREGNRTMERRGRVIQQWLKGRQRGRSGGAKRQAFQYQGFTPRSFCYALQKTGFAEPWVEPSPIFVEAMPGDSFTIPLARRGLKLTSTMLYQLSGRRLIASPNLLAFGRVAR
jgi:SAM-dependent methyltransferase